MQKVTLLIYEVTGECNSRCRHCGIWKYPPARDMLRAAELEKALADKLFDSLECVLLTGGEAVLKSDIEEMIFAIHRARPKASISLSTNGLMPEKVLGIAERSVSAGIPINVGVSVDAVGEMDDDIRGVKGAFGSASGLLRGLAKMKERYGSAMGVVVVGHTLSKLTAGTLDEVRSFAEGLGLAFMTQLYEEFPYYRISAAAQGCGVESYRSSGNEKLIRAVEGLPPSLHNEVILDSLRHRLSFDCAAMRSFFLLRSNGDVSPCLALCGETAGNIRSNTPSEIWESHGAARLRIMVGKCMGCSNSWASQWSREYRPGPFAKMLLNVKWKSLKLKALSRLPRISGKSRLIKYVNGSGIEIGALANPLPVDPKRASVTYVDLAGREEVIRQNPETASDKIVPADIIGDAESLTAIGGGSQDFVIASHLLEHLPDPIRALSEFYRVLKARGILYLSIPDKRYSFDRMRPSTPLSHIVNDFEASTKAGSDAGHYAEWFELVESYKKNPVAGSAAELMAAGYRIHFHCWTPEGIFALINHMSEKRGVFFRLRDYYCRKGDVDIIMILEKCASMDGCPKLPDIVEERP